jgi:DNA-binding NarL/FixJ family response regulator
MSDIERRYAPWPDLVAELLTDQPTNGFPRQAVEAALLETFGCRMTWNWREADGTTGFEMVGPWNLGGAEDQIVEGWIEHGGLDIHPLLRWFAASRDTRAMTSGRVPRSIATDECLGVIREILEPYESEQQLSIPFRIDGAEHRAYVLARSKEDFSDDDLAVARRVQPLLELLDRQARILEQRRPATTDSLTGRELATLALLADGLTAVAIAHRLAVSPRTVNKHLEHLYRKLGVRDRLQAVLVAGRRAGVRGGWGAGAIAGQRGAGRGPIAR